MLETILKGKIMMIPLLICSVTAMAVLIDRFWAYYQNSRLDTRKMRADILKHLRRGEIRQSAKLCVDSPGPVSAVLLAGLQAYVDLDRKTPENIRVVVGEAMDDHSLHSMSAVQKRMWVLSTVGNAAPLLGMTGTVTGMIKSFNELAKSGLDAGAVGVGIAEALITTAAGLIIALGAVIPYSFLVSKADAIELEIEEASSELLRFLANELPKIAASDSQKTLQ